MKTRAKKPSSKPTDAIPGVCYMCNDPKAILLPNRSVCQDCRNQWARDHYNQDTAYQETRRRQSREKGRAQVEDRLIKMCGINFATRDQTLRDQDYKCAICHCEFNLARPRSIHTDHDHETGAFRGLLCTRCNPGLGMFQDSIEILESAISYLARAEAASLPLAA